jgi:membrane protease YdiL (CAAX protease family)
LHEGGRKSAYRLLKRGLPSRIPFIYLLLIAFIPLGVNGAAYWLAGGRHPNFSPLTIFGTFVLYYFLGGSCGEEFGWRGYALDCLQRSWDWLAASLMIGVIWSAWHYPLSFLAGTTQSSTPEGVFFLSTVSLAVIMTYIYNRTGGNLFGMLLLHTFENITVVMFPPQIVGGVDRTASNASFIMAAAAMVLALTTWVRGRHRRRAAKGSVR